MGTTNGTVRTMEETTTQGPSVSAAIVRAPQVSAMEPASFGELKELAKHAAGSNFFGAKTPEQALMIMMAGKDLGLSYTQALRTFHVIQGRPVLSADGMVAVCLQSGVCEYFRVEGDDQAATAITKRRGQPEQRATFTMEDAKRASLGGKDNWRAYPGRMLKARAKANLARDVYPELLAGLYDPDELEPAPRHQAPEVVVQAQQERDPEARAAFADAIDQAADKRALKAVAASIKVARSRGVLDEADTLALSATFEAKLAALKSKAPQAPPSEPTATEGEVEQ